MKTRGDSVTETKEFLSVIPLFSKISASSAQFLAESSRFLQVERGEILFFQADPSDAVYVVRTGSISIVLNNFDGRQMVINEMRDGDVFGELGILTRKARSASAVAQAPSELLVIPRLTFLDLLDREPQLTRILLEITAGRLQLSGKRENALAFLDAQARLASLLLALEEQEQDKGYVTISQDELAHRTGLIRQTVAKALGKWRRAGWLITGRGRILILNRKALQDLENNLLI